MRPGGSGLAGPGFPRPPGSTPSLREGGAAPFFAVFSVEEGSFECAFPEEGLASVFMYAQKRGTIE